MTQAIYRSYLYVPAHQEHKIKRAYNSNADAIVLDLEDAVPYEMKKLARETAAKWLRLPPSKPTYVRINGVHSLQCREDIEVIACASLQAIRLPKCEQKEEILTISSWLDEMKCNARIQVLLESGLAIERAYDLATASPRVEMISLGESDLCTDLQITNENITLDICKVRCIIAARAAKLINPVQSVYPKFLDLEGFRLSCIRGKAMGFFGRFAIHPSQIPIINEIYTPTFEQLEEAQNIIDATLNKKNLDNESVYVLPNGSLIAPPFIEKAKKLLSLAYRLKLKE